MVTHNGRSVVEWNIDGLYEYQIIKILKHMTMFATACRNKGIPVSRLQLQLFLGLSTNFKLGGITICLKKTELCRKRKPA